MEKNRNNKLSIGSANFGLFYTSDKIKLKKKKNNTNYKIS